MNGRHLALRLGAGMVGLTTIATFGIAAAGPASAAGILPTKTTVTATPSTTANSVDGAVVLKATVGPLDLLVTPGGTVTFSSLVPGTLDGINSSPVKITHCLILVSTCTASLTINVAGAAPGAYPIVATYSGDSLSKASVGVTTLTITAAQGT